MIIVKSNKQKILVFNQDKKKYLLFIYYLKLIQVKRVYQQLSTVINDRYFLNSFGIFQTQFSRMYFFSFFVLLISKYALNLFSTINFLPKDATFFYFFVLLLRFIFLSF